MTTPLAAQTVTTGRQRWRRCLGWAGLGCARSPYFSSFVYVLLALWATWPLPRFVTSALPIGDLACGTVPLFNLWSLWWNADRALHGFQGYWDAPIFFPTPGSFAFSEPQPMSLLVAPLIWGTGSRVLAYNVYLWMSLVLNGVFAERLLRISGIGRWPSIFGGVLVLMLPIVHWQIDVLQLVPLWGVLWLWTALWQMSVCPRISTGFQIGSALAATFWSCGHHGLFLGLVVAFVFWLLPLRIRHWKWWAGGCWGVLVAGALIAPLAIPLRTIVRTHAFQRDVELVTQLSAVPGDYTSLSGVPLVPQRGIGTRPGWHLSVGYGKWGCAGLGLVLGFWRRRWRRWTFFTGGLLLMSVLLSLGPNLNLWGWQPWWTITNSFPGFSQVRNVFRFAFFVQLAAVLLCVQLVSQLSLLGRWWLRRPRSRRLATGGLVVLCLMLFLETRPRTPQMFFAPDAVGHADWADFVRRETPVGKGVLCLPMAAGDNVADYELTTRWMYMGTFHGVPLVNGYSGFFPNNYFEIQNAIAAKFPEPAIIDRLITENVEFLVVDAVAIQTRFYATTRFAGLRLELVHRSPLGIEVFRLRRVADPAQETTAIIP